MILPKEKKDALVMIEKINNATATCLEQENIEELVEVYYLRNNMIKQFFIDFKDELTDQDINFFRNIEFFDRNLLNKVNDLKSMFSEESKLNKKKFRGLRIYSLISNIEVKR